MNKFDGKSIVIAAPNHYGLLERFKENLKAIGFKVVVIPDDMKVNIGIKNILNHNYKKHIKGNSSLKREKKIELRTNKQIKILNYETIKYFDYALVIRPDLFSDDLLLHIKNKTDLMCAYQWDGLDRFPIVYKKISFFDKFFVFDQNDAKKNSNLIPITNFYFDDIKQQKNEIDAYFVGSFMENRIEILVHLSKKLKELGLRTSINLSARVSEREKVDQRYINIISKPLSFKDNIINSSKSKIILDLANNIHNGISMRVFESIGYKKKLITNNPLIKNYDFYHPNNIFVIENNDLEKIENFIQIPSVRLPTYIYEKYSFTNWMKKVLNTK